MVQTKQGAKKAKATLIKKYGKDGYREFFRKIGAVGGRNGHTGGFAANHALAIASGSKGGKRSKSGMKFVKEKNGHYIYRDKNGKKVIYRAGESMHGLDDIDKIEREMEVK